MSGIPSVQAAVSALCKNAAQKFTAKPTTRNTLCNARRCHAESSRGSACKTGSAKHGPAKLANQCSVRVKRLKPLHLIASDLREKARTSRVYSTRKRRSCGRH